MYEDNVYWDVADDGIFKIASSWFVLISHEFFGP